MPLTVKLKKKVSGDTWSATGTFSNSDGKAGPAEVLLKETGDKVQLILNSALMKSKIMNREVISFTNAKDATVEFVSPVKEIAEGAEIVIRNFWFNLNK